jgi:hypothetical protein
MLQSARNKERGRYYLLAGMGGRAAKRKHKLMLQWAIVAGLGTSVLLAWIIYLVNHSSH